MSRFTAVVLLTAGLTSATRAADDAAMIRRMIQAAGEAERAGEDAKAEALFRAVVVETEKGGGEDAGLAGELERLAAFLSSRERDDEATPLYRRALAIREKVQGKEHHDVATTLIGLALSGMKAKPKDGEQIGSMLGRALAIREATNGKDDTEVASVLQVMALWLEMEFWYEQAEAILVRTSAILEKKFGAESLRVAKVLDSLGRIHTKQLADGGPRFDRIVVPPQISALLPDVDRPVVEQHDDPVGVFREQHGRLAEEFYRRALAIREKTLPPDDPELAESRAHLGELEMRRGHTKEGAILLEHWIASQERARVPANLTQATVLTFLAQAAWDGKMPSQTERWLAKLEATHVQIDGEESKQVLVISIWRAETALQCGRFDAAAQFLDRALAIETAWKGHDDPEVAEARALMAGRYTDHTDDPQGYVRWHRLKMFGRLEDLTRTRGDTLSNIIRVYGKLLHRTNRAVPRPTEDDLAYFKKIGVISESDGMESLMDRLTLSDTTPQRGLDDAGLSHVERLFDLEHLALDSPLVTDAGLAHLRALPYLCCLFLSSPLIADPGLAQLSRVKPLEELSLGFNRVTDAGLKHLTALPNLRELDVASAEITDAGLQHMEAIKTLRKLRLRGSKVTQAAVDRLRRARPELVIELKTRSSSSGVE
ncbi:MAG: tetratricopeptide repeat protein [Isosphaeraceae bacterium]|nr:tetratricopeptide repeat protein [Isosphaeraceae bacterium]